MVHLDRVKNDHETKTPVLPGMEDLDINRPDVDEFTANVYGSRFAAMDIPKHEMPESEMPKEVAYRMIK